MKDKEYIVEKDTGEIILKNEIVEYQNNDVISNELIDVIDDFFMAKQRYDEMIRTNKSHLIEIVKANGEKTDSGKSIKLPTKYYNFLVTYEHTQDRFDTTRFKQDYPEVYEKYIKTGVVGESLKITERE